MEEKSKIIDEEDAEQLNQPWTLLYHGLLSLEKLIENQDKRTVV